MRLEAVSFVPPTRSVSNSEVVELVERTSVHAPADVVTRIGRKVDALLRRSGAVSRHWLGPGEEPLELIGTAASRAFAEAEMDPATVDVLIYASIDRGFIEPANAYFIAQALGLPTVECFDIVDACNGWSRAVQVAQALFAAGVYRTALIINAEFPMTPGVAVFPTAFDLRSEDELAWSFAAYTLGEGVTASLLSNADASPWTFQSVSRPSQAHLCTVSLPGYARYSKPGVEAAPSGPMRFSSWSTALFSAARTELLALFKQLPVPVETIRLIVPHAAGQSQWEWAANELGVGHLFHYLYPNYGNLGSASIPAGLATAATNACLNRGDRVLTCSASAGMVFTLTSFVY
jgi:3-oxoacyl-[acyl-carrier-protein] synthase III